MKKMVVVLFCLVLSYAWGEVVNGIALVINDAPITLLDINKTATKYGCSSKEAIEILIQKNLEEGELSKYRIGVDPYELDGAIEAFAAKNGLSVGQLKENLRAKMVDYDDYKAEFKARLLRDKLKKKIVSANVNAVDERELRKFYEANSDKFSFPETIHAIQYSSSSKLALETVRNNPLSISKDVQKEEVSLEAKTLNPQLLGVLNETKKGAFTPVLNAGGSFVTFYIQEKMNVKAIAFEHAKNSVYNLYAVQNEEQTMKSHFEKLKANAKLELIRVPE